jgi:hypothetical protein
VSSHFEDFFRPVHDFRFNRSGQNRTSSIAKTSVATISDVPVRTVVVTMRTWFDWDNDDLACGGLLFTHAFCFL